MSAMKSTGHADALWGSIEEVISTGREATVKKFVLHTIAIIVAAVAVGSAGIATDALAFGGGGGHGMGGEHFGGSAEPQGYGHYRGWERSTDAMGDYDACWPHEQVRPRRLRYYC